MQGNKKNEISNETLTGRSESIKKKIVLGTAGLGGLWGEVNMNESINAILYGLENGINCFDTAPAYNNAEEILGNVLRQWKGERPSISTKVGRLKANSPDINLYDYSSESIKKSIYTSLEVLHLDYVDVLFLHDPDAIISSEISRVIQTLVGFKEMGIVKSIGIGGNFSTHFQPYISDKVFNVFMGYNRFNAVCNYAVNNEFKFLSNQNINIWQASPLYMGLLGNKFNTYCLQRPEWIPEQHIRKAILLKQFCDSNNMELSEVALRYLQGVSFIDKIVIGASTLPELKRTVDYFNRGNLPDNTVEHIDNTVNS